jgi:ABC-type sugar transport system substrate-binding protein
MDYGANAALDAFSHGLDHTLAAAGIDLQVAYADFRTDGWLAQTERLIRAGVAEGLDAIVLYTIDPCEPAQAVAEARRRGVCVVALERPRFEVDACAVLPNFNHGAYLAEHLATLVPRHAKVGVIGGPGTSDDTELVAGILHGLKTRGLIVVNDPLNPRYRNISDVRTGGHNKAVNMLADFAELDAIVPYNDESALGAIEALRETGRLGSLKIVSRNGTPEVVRLVAEGVHHGTWDQDVLGIGRVIGELVIKRVVEKQVLDSLCVASPIGRVVTQERARAWQPWEKRVLWRRLALFESAVSELAANSAG